jgi:ferritin-like metal-binding protein YciE
MLEILKSEKSNADQPMLKKLFMDELKDIYGAEKQLVKALPEMADAANSQDLVAAFADHLRVTENQVSRLEKVFQLLGEEPSAKECKGMKGIVEEGKHIIKDTEKGTATRDVGLIMAAQKVEHYEIAAYGSLRQLARLVNLAEVTALLEETLAEEKETDMVLSNMADMFVNKQAVDE